MNRRAEAVAALRERLGHDFADPALLERALTHPSVGHGSPKVASYEVLEFLGDRVLGLLVAEDMVRADPTWREGDLTRRHVSLVSGATCAKVARRLGVAPALRMEGSAAGLGARDNDRVLGDAMEAILAAVYLDAGLEAARSVYRSAWSELIETAMTTVTIDAKTRLNEWAGAHAIGPVTYHTVSRSGSDHAPTFEVEVKVGDLPPVSATGGAVRAAEQAAAAAFLQREDGET